MGRRPRADPAPSARGAARGRYRARWSSSRIAARAASGTGRLGAVAHEDRHRAARGAQAGAGAAPEHAVVLHHAARPDPHGADRHDVGLVQPHLGEVVGLGPAQHEARRALAVVRHPALDEVARAGRLEPGEEDGVVDVAQRVDLAEAHRVAQPERPGLGHARGAQLRRAEDCGLGDHGAGAGEGNRTLVLSLGSSCSTIELHPQSIRLAIAGLAGGQALGIGRVAAPFEVAAAKGSQPTGAEADRRSRRGWPRSGTGARSGSPRPRSLFLDRRRSHRRGRTGRRRNTSRPSRVTAPNGALTSVGRAASRRMVASVVE